LSQFNYVVNDRISLDVGVDAEYTEGELTQSQQGPTEGSAFLVETIPAGKHYDYDVDATLLAPFFALNWQDDKWAIQLGGRFETMRYDYANNMNTGRVRENGTECGFGGCRYSRPADSENDYNNFSPKLSLRYQLSPQIQLFGGVARGYRAPQATELYRLQRAQTVTELESVTADNVELGITGSLLSGGYTLSFYSLEKDNVIYRDSDFFNVSNGETWHRGVELTFDQQLSDVLRVDFAGTYARHTYEHSQLSGELDIKGNDIDTAPKVLFNTRLSYDVTEEIQAQLEWQHVSSYYTDAENLNEYDGHDLVHGRISWDVTNSITLYARINNMLDTEHAERADYTSFSGPRYFPGRPRNFMLSASFIL